MNRRLKRTAIGASALVVAVLVTTLVVSQPDEPLGAKITVPQAQDSDVDPDIRTPPPTSVSVILPSSPIDTTIAAPPPPPRTPPATSAHRQPPVQSQPTSPRPAPVDFQAEEARIHKGSVQSNHSGFTGSGFVDYFNEPGGFVEWTVTATATGGTDAVFRFANGSNAPRPMAITVNGILVSSAAFPVTNGWSDWRTLTVHISLLTGTNRIRAIGTGENGGANLDKVTVVLPPS
ncbi:carbohydrate-binding protein [Kibdelosporangium aridum]|uniref:carbohydrate-binding protein n=1 Tax=Kibdelosporangium aridum TaxID=2030 RepID=UPI000561D4EE|nr:carbohydrate-binding protein [Kibdelosporangium aridum]